MKPEMAHRARLVLLVWLLVAIFYFYLAYDYVRADMRDREFGDYVRSVVQLAGIDKRPTAEVRTLVLAKAEELALPVGNEQIAVTGEGEALTVKVEYQVDVDLPILSNETVLYRKKFTHNVRFR